MTQNDEVSNAMLMALADGELNDLDAARLRLRIAGDPALAERYAVFAQTRAWMQEAFRREPLPERLIASVMQAAQEPAGPSNVVPLRRRHAGATGWGMAFAASVLLGICGFWAGRGSLADDPGFAGVALAVEALSTGEETRLPDGSTARVLASYQTDLGLCRMVAHDDWRHVACKNDPAGSWDVALSVHAGEADSYLPSSDLAVELIDRLLDEIGAGAALDPEAERRALAQ